MLIERWGGCFNSKVDCRAEVIEQVYTRALHDKDSGPQERA